MINFLTTCLQLFGIGFSFAMAGPCLFLCTPILITYVSGSGKPMSGILRDIFVFLSGRLSAYIVLGALAGLSMVLLRHFTSPHIAALFRPSAGVITIILGVLTLVYRERDGHSCAAEGGRRYGSIGLFALGFAIGIAPCAPLVALLFDIALMSKNIYDSLLYIFSFGLGTFLSSMIVAGVLGGAVKSVASKTLRSKRPMMIFRIACAILLITMGMSLII